MGCALAPTVSMIRISESMFLDSLRERGRKYPPSSVRRGSVQSGRTGYPAYETGAVLGRGQHRGRRDAGSRQGVAVRQWGCSRSTLVSQHKSCQRPRHFSDPRASNLGCSTPHNSQGSPRCLPSPPHSRISAEIHPSYHLPPTPRRARPPPSGHPGHGRPAPFRLPARVVRTHRTRTPFDRPLRTWQGSWAYRTGQRIGISFPSPSWSPDKVTRAPSPANPQGHETRLQTRVCRHRISCLERPLARDRIPLCVHQAHAIAAVAVLISNM